jgi:predicted acylesterase/phospholipase RssA
MLASASIPAAFPPVMIQVEADGELYDEMHVDGGATTMVYTGPLNTNYRAIADRLEAKGKPNIFVIRNGWLTTKWISVERQTIAIAVRTMETMFNSLLYGDLYRIYLATYRDEFNFNLAYIPESFYMESKEPFDPEYMTALFNVGYEMARDGYEWETAPPGYEEGSQ